MDDLQCRTEKATRLFAELDSKKGVGLIERVRQGQGKPSRIYIKNFAKMPGLAKANRPKKTKD